MKTKIGASILCAAVLLAVMASVRSKHIEKNQRRVEIKLAEVQESEPAIEFPPGLPHEDEPEQVGEVVFPSKLNITEEMVKLLEQEKETLRSTASVTPQKGGWKVQKNDQYLSRLGVRTGDVITIDTLRAGLSDPARGDLAKRLSAVLQYIERTN